MHFNRRRILQSSAAITALGSLGACAGGDENTPDTGSLEVETPPVEAAPEAYTAMAIPDGLEQLEMLANGAATSLSLTEAAIARSKAFLGSDNDPGPPT